MANTTTTATTTPKNTPPSLPDASVLTGNTSTKGPYNFGPAGDQPLPGSGALLGTPGRDVSANQFINAMMTADPARAAQIQAYLFRAGFYSTNYVPLYGHMRQQDQDALVNAVQNGIDRGVQNNGSTPFDQFVIGEAQAGDQAGAQGARQYRFARDIHLTNPADLTTQLDQTFTNMLGRGATDGEKTAFVSAFQDAERKNQQAAFAAQEQNNRTLYTQQNQNQQNNQAQFYSNLGQGQSVFGGQPEADTDRGPINPTADPLKDAPTIKGPDGKLYYVKPDPTQPLQVQDHRYANYQQMRDAGKNLVHKAAKPGSQQGGYVDPAMRKANSDYLYSVRPTNGARVDYYQQQNPDGSWSIVHNTVAPGSPGTVRWSDGKWYMQATTQPNPGIAPSSTVAASGPSGPMISESVNAPSPTAAAEAAAEAHPVEFQGTQIGANGARILQILSGEKPSGEPSSGLSGVALPTSNTAPTVSEHAWEGV